MCEALREQVPQLTVSTTNDLMKETLPRLVTDVVYKEKESSKAVNTVLNVHPTISTSTATTSDLQQQLYLKMKSDLQSQVSARGSSSKQPAKETNTSTSEQPQQQDLDAWVDILVIDEDEVISEEETPELIDEFQNIDKRVPTIYDHERMEATIRDMLSNQFRDAEEYAYHMEQAQKFMEN
ncbi:hypothetical protein Tco_1198898 [Tanacetum coccineum]